MQDRLRLERQSIDAARAALARGQADESLRQLQRHRRAFGDGQLAEERDALSVRALVAAGRTEEARQHAARFVAAYPSSLFRGAVQSALTP